MASPPLLRRNAPRFSRVSSARSSGLTTPPGKAAHMAGAAPLALLLLPPPQLSRRTRRAGHGPSPDSACCRPSTPSWSTWHTTFRRDPKTCMRMWHPRLRSMQLRAHPTVHSRHPGWWRMCPCVGRCRSASVAAASCCASRHAISSVFWTRSLPSVHMIHLHRPPHQPPPQPFAPEPPRTSFLRC